MFRSECIKHYTTLCVTVCTALMLFLSAEFAQAQLPPTIYRISERDTAVDVPSDNIHSLFAPSVSSAFGSALNTSGHGMIISGSPDLNNRPISAEMWIKLNSIEKFNIFLAHEPKSSPRHWEFYSFTGTGKLALYLPGNPAGDTILSKNSLKIGQWQHIAFVMTNEYAELFIDGISEGKGKIDRKEPATPMGTKFAIGSLVENGLFCNGLIDEIRIVQGILPFSAKTIPQKPYTVDNKTIFLCHFETDQQEQNTEKNVAQKNSADSNKISAKELVRSADRADKVNRFNKIPKTLRASTEKAKPGDFLHFNELDTTKKQSISLEGTLAKVNKGQIDLKTQFDSLFPIGATEIEVKPGEKPARNIPFKKCTQEDFTKRVKELGLKSIAFDDFRPGVFEHWGEQFYNLANQLSKKIQHPRGAEKQVYSPDSLVFPDKEKHPVQVVIRRIKASFGKQPAFDSIHTPEANDLRQLEKKINVTNIEQSDIDYFLACALRRKIMFTAPELDELDRILFLARACYSGSRLTNMHNSDRIGGHFATQIYGFNTIQGGGLFTIENWREKSPVITDLIKGKKVKATKECNRLAGKELNYGSFMSPELSFDGKTIYFSHCGSKSHRWIWTPDTTWNIFKMSVEGGPIEQLTDSAYNDFDVCELPNGRLAFCSERRGGFIRCFGEGAELRVTTSVLHSMKNDGSDIYPISFFETSEWQPSVDNNGMLVYTRWDYTDRENCLGSTFWTCAPDGRNPRSPHGNYPFPWHTFEDNKHGDHRFGLCSDAESALPMTEMQFRAIPDSHKYIFTAAPHHGETFGSLCILDLRQKNDNHMSQVRRLTPYVPFPESEAKDRSQYQYGAPWPITEQLYLCNCWENLVLLDCYGNEELLCERELLPIGYDPRLRLSEPIPLAERFRPAVIPQQTAQGIDNINKDQKSVVGIINVNITDQPFPKDRKPVKIRIVQVIPKPNPWMDRPFIGYATENTPRIPLGTVPLEKDGSAFFQVPSGKQILFQALDENNQAIQTMRAVTFAHPGEKLVCTGCHEPVDETIRNAEAYPLAFKRAPSIPKPECGPVEPMNFYRFIKPVLDSKCTPCHIDQKKGPQKMDYEALRPYVYYFSGGMRGDTMFRGIHGGSRSIPGRVGASASKLSKILYDKNHQTVTQEDRHKFVLWLDLNAPRLGAFQDEKGQVNGQLVWPLLDSDPCFLYDPEKTVKNTK